MTKSLEVIEAILVISPHPDDLEIAMGGTVAKEIAQGKKVISIVLTDGRRSQRSFVCSDEEIAKIRQQEVREAAQVLGISKLYNLELEDLHTSENQEKLNKQLSKLIKQYKPKEIYLPHPELDRHPTHQLAARLVFKLIEELINNNKDNDLATVKIWAYEVWGLFANWDLEVDISDFAEKKLAAINCHKSQIKDLAYSEGVLGLNRWRAVFSNPHSISKTTYKEVFIKLK
ncbi:MAG: PIG-L family deacetylase [Blastocatellia bacterium]|nr:PIG-L family deacetylase [Blastocatellia bacterium]MBL8192383.1 PIG-L family deacetylase [Blastocatellia bacterium]